MRHSLHVAMSRETHHGFKCRSTLLVDQRFQDRIARIFGVITVIRLVGAFRDIIFVGANLLVCEEHKIAQSRYRHPGEDTHAIQRIVGTEEKAQDGNSERFPLAGLFTA